MDKKINTLAIDNQTSHLALNFPSVLLVYYRCDRLLPILAHRSENPLVPQTSDEADHEENADLVQRRISTNGTGALNVRLEASHPAEWQHGGNQIDAAMIFAGADFVNVLLRFHCEDHQ